MHANSTNGIDYYAMYQSRYSTYKVFTIKWGQCIRHANLEKIYTDVLEEFNSKMHFKIAHEKVYRNSR